jgi:hypothetical protein
MSPPPILEGLPCQDVIRKGIQDLENSQTTLEACLASMSSPRLQRAGLLRPDIKIIPEAERTLYRLLRAVPGNAYGRYNALGRELVSFEHGLDARLVRPNRFGRRTNFC